MTDPIIITRNLSKVYRMESHTVTALRGVSMDIGRGEFMAVMGPSGSGKSTFMNLLGCLDTPGSGEYLLAGERVSGLDRDALAAIRNRRIGFVFQSFNLLPRTPALENIALPLLYCGVPAEERERRAAARLAEVGLAERGHHHPAQLSGGQQQRVAIARALVNDPVLILADEPTGALDTLTSCEVMALLQQLNAHGMTVVLVTHERDIAEFAKRVITFRDGAVVEDHAVEWPKDAAAMAEELRTAQQPRPGALA
ncbi:MAG: ABC transporter ATP-binding protein [Burkholderiales bacterium]|nr:ABC transporter ATP-binding protein [Burkholderiales bacterium]